MQIIDKDNKKIKNLYQFIYFLDFIFIKNLLTKIKILIKFMNNLFFRTKWVYDYNNDYNLKLLWLKY